ncbi:hypothetical protein [Numidum massiliense]|uniref:hypothetical protein n=1 Tax=Numidum massiliense TaxID=1522315 RepID=UPI0006D573FD|nr:hypothetical protein [Numidum massiliense]
MGFGAKEKNIAYHVKVDYISSDFSEWEDSELGWVRGVFNYNGKFEKKAMPGKTINYGTTKTEFEHENDTVYDFFSYIRAEDNPQEILFYYSVACQDSEKPCNLDVKQEEQKAKLLMESVTFIEPSSEERSDEGGE